MALTVLVALASCRDKATEKRIADLESRLSKLENGGSSSTSSVTPGDQLQEAKPAAAETKPEGPLPVLQFEKMEHDFGTIKEGQKVSFTYKLKNTGEAPLIIQNAQPSCGCTAPDWTREPIPAGGTGFVKAEFDSKGKPGIQNKTITVTANTWPKTVQLKFKASVTASAETNGPAK